jgi:hypothetical protein
MEYPEVTVVEITDTPEYADCIIRPNLGDPVANLIMNDLLKKMRESSKKTFHLKWKGGKIPRGAIIEGVPIGWTQHGMVIGTNSEPIGTYERMVEFGGKDQTDQEILIFVQ